jgi:hypothetical protein
LPIRTDADTKVIMKMEFIDKQKSAGALEGEWPKGHDQDTI